MSGDSLQVRMTCDSVWTIMGIQQSEVQSTEFITHDWMGSLFEVTTKDARKYLVRKPKFEITQEELTKINEGVPSEYFLTNIKLTEAGALVTEITGLDSLHALNRFGPQELFVPLAEFEAFGVLNRVVKILLKAEQLKLDTFDIAPNKLYCKKIPGVTASMAIKGSPNYDMWLAEPYMDLAILKLREPNPPSFYFDRSFHDKHNEKKLAWSLGNLMFYLAYGSQYDDCYNECKSLSYSYTRQMFQMMKTRVIERASVQDGVRTVGAFINDTPLVLYPAVSVQNYLTQKGIYTGTLKYGVMHGYGQMEITKSFGLFNEVKTFEGYFCNEKMHLYGEINYRNSEKYVGQISWDIPWGRGAMTNVNGVVREGKYEGTNILDDENSIIRYTDGSSIQGPTVRGVANGKCIQTLPDGTVWEGEFKMGRKNGHFTARRYHPEDKDFLVMSFDGEFLDDKKHGKVDEFEYEKFKFNGMYDNGRKTGYGIYSVHEKFEYDGDLLNDQYQGDGYLKKFSWAGTETYRGQFERGQYHGPGLLTMPDGTSYRGEWVHGVKSGEFEVVDLEGYPRFALFIDGDEIADEM